MAFCANRCNVNSLSVYRKIEKRSNEQPRKLDNNNKSKPAAQAGEKPSTAQVDFDRLLQYYCRYYVSIEKYVGVAANIPMKEFKSDPHNFEMPIVHRDDGHVMDNFRGFEKNIVYDLIFGYSVIEKFNIEPPKDAEFLAIARHQKPIEPDELVIHAQPTSYVPPIDSFDVPVIATHLPARKPDAVNIGFHDETLTRRYARYLRKTLFEMSIRVEVLVVNVHVKDDHAHNGYHMFVYGFLESLLIAGIPLYVPGFNVRELLRDFIGYEIYTSITNKGWYKQWYGCVIKDLIKYAKSIDGDYSKDTILDCANKLISTYVLDSIPTDKVMVLGYAFNPYLCNHYDPTKDYCIISQPVYNHLFSNNICELHDKVIFDSHSIGDIYGVMLPCCNIYSIKLGDNMRRYYDFIPRKFGDLLRKQSYYTVENSNIMVFYPTMTIYTIHDGKNLPLVRGLDHINAYANNFTSHSFPESLCFIDETTKTYYFAKGDYTSQCYERAVVDAFESINVNMKAQFDNDIIHTLTHCNQCNPEFYVSDNGEDIVINSDIALMPNFDLAGALPPALPDGINPKAYILLFDLTFGQYRRRDRFKQAILRIRNWRNLYNGNQQYNNDAQLLDLIADQYHIRNNITPYADYTLEYFVTNVRQLQDNDGNPLPQWDQLSAKYIYPGRFNDERHTIRILQLNNLTDDTAHAYCLYNGGQDMRDHFLYFCVPDTEVSHLVKEYPGRKHSRIGVRVSKMTGKTIPVFNPKERGINGMAAFDPVLTSPNAFARNLDAQSNYIQISDEVSKSLGLFYYDENGVKHYCHFIFSNHIFVQKAFQYLGDEFAIAQVDELYIRLMLGEQFPFIQTHYVHIDNRLINKRIINPTPYCCHLTKWKGPNQMNKPFYARVKDWYVYEVRCNDNDVIKLSDNINKSTLTPLFIDTRLLQSYDLYGVAKRPIQAFYRDVVKCMSEAFLSRSLADHSIYTSDTLVSATLIYIEQLHGMDRIHVDGNVCGIAQGLTFDKKMKSIPYINSQLIPLKSDGNIMKYTYYYYCFLSPSFLMGKSIYCYYNNTCPENITEAVCARQCMYRPGAVYHENVYHAFDLFYKHFADYFEDAVQLTASELLKVHKNGRKYLKSYCAEDSIIYLAFSAFIKTEPYPFEFDSHKIKPPRLIMNPGKLVNFFMITFSHMLEECLKRIPYFAKGKNSRETGEDLWKLWSRLKHPCAIGMDFTQFEHFVSTSVLVASMSIFVHLTGMPERYVRKWVKRLVYLCKMYKLNFLATRISGEFQTSFGNMIIVGAILYYVIHNVKQQHPGSQAYFYSAGDDCMILCNIEDQQYYKDEMSRIVTDFGMIVKTEAVYTEFDTIHFCQQYPVYVNWTDEEGNEKKVWWMVNDIVRVLDKLSVQPKVPRFTKSDLNRWACLGCYIEFMFGSLPELNALIHNLKKLAPYKFHGQNRPDFRRAFKTSQDWHIIEALGSSHNFKPEYTIINPLRFYQVCGMDRWVMKFYSEYFPQWSPYDYLDHRVDVEFFAEKDGSTTFQYGNYSLLKCVHKYQDTQLESPQFRQEDPSYTELSEALFHKMLNVCGGYTF